MDGTGLSFKWSFGCPAAVRPRLLPARSICPATRLPQTQQVDEILRPGGLFQVGRVRRWHHIHVLRRADVAVIADRDPPDEHEVDSPGYEFAEDPSDVEVSQRAGGDPPRPPET